MHGHTYSKSKDRPGKVANPARGQLSMEYEKIIAMFLFHYFLYFTVFLKLQ